MNSTVQLLETCEKKKRYDYTDHNDDDGNLYGGSVPYGNSNPTPSTCILAYAPDNELVSKIMEMVKQVYIPGKYGKDPVQFRLRHELQLSKINIFFILLSKILIWDTLYNAIKYV